MRETGGARIAASLPAIPAAPGDGRNRRRGALSQPEVDPVDDGVHVDPVCQCLPDCLVLEELLAPAQLVPADVALGLGRQAVRGYRIVGVGGETQVEAAYIEEFKIGQATRKGWRVIVAGEKDLGESIAFILGDDFFSQVDVEFDLAHNAVRLFQPKDCNSASLAYWAPDDHSDVAIERVDDFHPQIVLTALINGQPLKALLDSGSPTSVLTKSAAARLGVTPETPGVVATGSAIGVGPNAIDSWIGPFESVVIGNERIRDTTIRFADLYNSNAPHLHPMLLGVDFLRSHRVFVAHSQRKMYFT